MFEIVEVSNAIVAHTQRRQCSKYNAGYFSDTSKPQTVKLLHLLLPQMVGLRVAYAYPVRLDITWMTC